MRVVVIGGTGHIGTYLSPLLAEVGHEVVCVSRGTRRAYQPHEAWSRIATVALDRVEEEARGAFGRRIAETRGRGRHRPDVLHPGERRSTGGGAARRAGHFLHCGTIWVHGHCVEAPTTEDAPRAPFGEYGIRKAAIEAYLREEGARRVSGHCAASGRPGGDWDGRPSIRPAISTWRSSRRSRRDAKWRCRTWGMETLHHVHASDVRRSRARWNIARRRWARVSTWFRRPR